MDVVAVVRCDWPLPRPTQLPVHSVLPETLRLAAAERLRLPQLPKGKHTKSVVRDGVGTDFCLTRQTERVPIGRMIELLCFSLFLRYVRTMVLIWTRVRRGRCWVCWWMPTVVSTSMSMAWTRAWQRRTFLRPATPSSISTASVNRYRHTHTQPQSEGTFPFYCSGVMSQLSLQR